MHADLSDAALVARVRHGDVDAYATLVERYQAPAVRLASLVTRDPAEADDIAQEAFIKAYYALDRFRPDASFRPWLLRIVANEARNSRSARQRRTALHSRVADAEPQAAGHHSAEDSVVADEQRTALLQAMDQLRDEDRTVLAYRYLFDMSEAEMAQALDVAPGTVKSRLSRSLARLRESLTRVAPLVVVPLNVEQWLAHALPEAMPPAHPTGGTPVLAAVLEHIHAATGAAAAASGRPSVQHIALASAGGGVALAAIATVGLLLSTSQAGLQRADPPATGTTVVVAAPATPALAVATPSPPPAAAGAVAYGGDLTDAQRAELQQAFGAAADALQTQVVSRADLVATLQAAGLPVDGSERAVTSALVACQSPGSGVHVRTQNITDIPAAAYANALVTAGIADAAVTVAAPASRPMTGETGLIGVLRAYPACHAGEAIPPTRLRLAFDQLHVTADLADSGVGWDHAAAAILRATQAVVSSPGGDASAALDQALAAENLSPSADWRDEATAMLRALSGVEHGPYGRGYALEQVAVDDAWIRAVQP